MEKLNFGCGKNLYTGKEWINVDIQKADGIDFSFDFNSYPYPFESNTFSHILADNVIEHLISPKDAIDELWRISKNMGTILVKVPYWNAKCAYNDITHLHYFNEAAVLKIFELQSSYIHNSNSLGTRFELLQLSLVPSNKCKVIPMTFREILSVYLNNIIKRIDILVKVKK